MPDQEKKKKKKVKTKSDGFHGHIFVNRRDETLLCSGRVKFLESIDRLGSIKKAADEENISYRKAWNMVDKANDAAGVPLVETIKGGSGGGSSRLTAAGKKVLELFMEFENRHVLMMDEFTEEFEKRFSEIINKEKNLY
ncbi:MAG: LysR family transcriptional regulator [Chloroflexi bacterium]|nr:LysR family transcriptional regulator [Chloroflexota bacterium]